MLCRASGDVLLNHDDVLQITPTISIQFRAKFRADSSLDSVRREEMERFSSQFSVIDRVLGSGACGSVFVAVKRSTSRQVACKIVKIVKVSSIAGVAPQANSTALAEIKAIQLRLLKRRADLPREYEVLKDLSHPNIISLEKVFCTTHSVYIFQELIPGGDLMSSVDRTNGFSEPEAAVIIRQVLKAVQYLHSNQIVHRDIKPENVLMTSWRQGARVVLTDFGHSRKLGDGKGPTRSSAVFRMQSLVGTFGYIAPEVVEQQRGDRKQAEGYGKAVDLWSVGCVAGLVLTGELLPLDNRGRSTAPSQAQASTARWDLTFIDTAAAWRDVSRKAKAFVRGCLNIDEDERLNAEQALQHQWFTHKHYAAELEAAYCRAVQDWKPRRVKGSLVEFIDTSDIIFPDPQDTRDPQETTSRHFQNESDHVEEKDIAKITSNYAHLPPPFSKRTVDQAFGKISVSPSVSSFSQPGTRSELSASPLCVPNTPPRMPPQPAAMTADSSNEHDTSPKTHLPLEYTMPSLPPYSQGWQREVMPLQSHFESGQLSLSAMCREKLLLEPDRRTASTHKETQRAEVTQYTGDLDSPCLGRWRACA
ncbi:hypothetical protein LTS02_012544 [Friedmanniomyces endolithicus]|nr:hypothetical protein LTR94_004964 [Friedmanniomyces endolithicus]KAK0814199.1 hypothetical protein LTR75_004368 [Friedmanniomyces endolithicus]KAK0852050.1 hypothetical protein LTS02_012544 [Friedmanniomyces endolithicus]